MATQRNLPPPLNFFWNSFLFWAVIRAYTKQGNKNKDSFILFSSLPSSFFSSLIDFFPLFLRYTHKILHVFHFYLWTMAMFFAETIHSQLALISLNSVMNCSTSWLPSFMESFFFSCTILAFSCFGVFSGSSSWYNGFHKTCSKTFWRINLAR